jgi:hypothetical protein
MENFTLNLLRTDLDEHDEEAGGHQKPPRVVMGQNCPVTIGLGKRIG